MYATHFGLTERPFSLAPDPRYLYLSDAHREALAHLLYGVGGGGSVVQLTGEVGTGKTTVCRALLEQVPPDVDVAMIFNPRLTSVELLAVVCDELRVAYPAGTTSLKVLVDALSQALLEAHGRGRRTVLIIDEAQNLSAEVLEEVRLLTNLETTREKLLQVILIGQPELAEILARPDLRQLAQRVTARYHLRPFTEEETRAYVQHRMEVAGQRQPIFETGAVRVAHRRAHPRHRADRAPGGAGGARPAGAEPAVGRRRGDRGRARRRRQRGHPPRRVGAPAPRAPGAPLGRCQLGAGDTDGAGRPGAGGRACAPRADAHRDPGRPLGEHRRDDGVREALRPLAAQLRSQRDRSRVRVRVPGRPSLPASNGDVGGAASPQSPRDPPARHARRRQALRDPDRVGRRARDAPDRRTKRDTAGRRDRAFLGRLVRRDLEAAGVGPGAA